MRNIAEFTLIGWVGTIKQVGKTVRVSICANYPFKDDKGQWMEDAHWNEVTIFTKSVQSYVNEHVSKGDLVHVRVRLRQNSFERQAITRAAASGGCLGLARPDEFGDDAFERRSALHRRPTVLAELNPSR
jgi:single-strand DNA-binding protein